MYYTYVLYSKRCNKIYIGYSSDLELRLSFHNSLDNSGWTKRFQPREVLYYEEYDEKKVAMQREKQLTSSRGRNFIYEMVRDKLS